MPATILRAAFPKRLRILVNESETEAVNCEEAVAAMLYVPVGFAAADIVPLAAWGDNDYEPAAEMRPSPPGYQVVQDESGVALTITGVVPGRWHAVPEKALRGKYLKFRSASVGTVNATAQPAQQDLVLVMKS